MSLKTLNILIDVSEYFILFGTVFLFSLAIFMMVYWSFYGCFKKTKATKKRAKNKKAANKNPTK